MKKNILLAAGLFLLVLSIGCGGNCTVRGTVTFPDGAPLERGTVMFESSAIVASGVIQKNGTYSIIAGDKKGVPPGTYKVCIGGLNVPTVTTMPSPSGQGPAKIKVTKPDALIDSKYFNSTTSGLVCEVKGRTKFDIVVEPAP